LEDGHEWLSAAQSGKLHHRRLHAQASLPIGNGSRPARNECTARLSLLQLGRAGQFRRVLGLWQLTAIGLGGLIGAGIFVLTAVVAATQAGPAVSLSFGIAGIASAAAALCHAEFAGMISVAGSAYTYGYAVLGELATWVIGWDLLLEYALVVAVVSIGWSGYLQALLSQLGLLLPSWAMGASGTGPAHVLDLPAMLGSLAVAGLLTLRHFL
jgi:APA family basic amino acid/polyamine antiporter